ncbi:hypothetical protein DSUL_140031 [Desulfovibrionales bacterium]
MKDHKIFKLEKYTNKTSVMIAKSHPVRISLNSLIVYSIKHIIYLRALYKSKNNTNQLFSPPSTPTRRNTPKADRNHELPRSTSLPRNNYYCCLACKRQNETKHLSEHARIDIIIEAVGI